MYRFTSDPTFSISWMMSIFVSSLMLSMFDVFLTTPTQSACKMTCSSAYLVFLLTTTIPWLFRSLGSPSVSWPSSSDESILIIFWFLSLNAQVVLTFCFRVRLSEQVVSWSGSASRCLSCGISHPYRTSESPPSPVCPSDCRHLSLDPFNLDPNFSSSSASRCTGIFCLCSSFRGSRPLKQRVWDWSDVTLTEMSRVRTVRLKQ